MNRALVFLYSLLSLLWVSVCSQAAWAGHRNLSASAVPLCPRGVPCHQGRNPAVRAQGALLQAAALSVAVGPGPQQQAEPRQFRALSGRSRARLPAWYRRAQSAQRLGQTPAVVVARPAHQPQQRRRVRAPSGFSVAGSISGSAHKPARQQRAMVASSVARAGSASVSGRSRLVSEPRGARRRRMVNESASSTWAFSEDVSQRPVSDDASSSMGFSTGEPGLAAASLSSVVPSSTAGAVQSDSTDSAGEPHFATRSRLVVETPFSSGAVLVDPTASKVESGLTVGSTPFPEPTPTHGVTPAPSGGVLCERSDSGEICGRHCSHVSKQFRYGAGSVFENLRSEIGMLPELRIQVARGGNWSKEFCAAQLSGNCTKYCYPVEVCDYKGGVFHSLTLTEETGGRNRWLLVTLTLRNTTDPAWMNRRSPGNASERVDSAGEDPEPELEALRGEFRLLSFYRSGMTSEQVPQEDMKRWTRGSWSLGEQLYIGEAPPDNATVRTLMASNGTLYQVYAFPESGGDHSRYLRWSSFPPQNEEQFWQYSWPPASFAYSDDRPLPRDHHLMLLSEEEDGINVWLKCVVDGVIKRFALEEIKKQGENATETSTFKLGSDSNAKVEPLALARHEDWLYSVHQQAGEDWQLRRWNITDGQQDLTWQHQLSATLNLSDPRLIASAHDSSLYLVPNGGLAYKNGASVGAWQLVIPATIDPQGDCRKWRRVSLGGVVELPPSDVADDEVVCPYASHFSSDDAVYAALSLLGLVPAGGIALGVGGYAYKRCFKRRDPVDRMAPESRPEEGVSFAVLKGVQDFVDEQEPAAVMRSCPSLASLHAARLEAEKDSDTRESMEADREEFGRKMQALLADQLDEEAVNRAESGGSADTYVLPDAVLAGKGRLSVPDMTRRSRSDGDSSGTRTPKLISAGD